MCQEKRIKGGHDKLNYSIGPQTLYHPGDTKPTKKLLLPLLKYLRIPACYQCSRAI